MTPAPSRRPKMPTTLRTATPRMAAAEAASAPAATRPSSNAGTITSPATRPITNALATVIPP